MANTVLLMDEDVFDVVCLCHAALAQDSPKPSTFYLNQILNLMFGYLPTARRKDIEMYLAEKQYLPDVKIEIIRND